jgi:hypothetical protein
MNKLERFNLVRKIKLNLSDIKPNKMEEGEGLEGACWEGYEPIGTKLLDGKEVPNCVPVEAKKVKQGFPIPSPEGGESDDEFISRCMKEIGGEYDQDQALGICYSKLRGE